MENLEKTIIEFIESMEVQYPYDLKVIAKDTEGGIEGRVLEAEDKTKYVEKLKTLYTQKFKAITTTDKVVVDVLLREIGNNKHVRIDDEYVDYLSAIITLTKKIKAKSSTALAAINIRTNYTYGYNVIINFQKDIIKTLSLADRQIIKQLKEHLIEFKNDFGNHILALDDVYQLNTVVESIVAQPAQEVFKIKLVGANMHIGKTNSDFTTDNKKHRLFLSESSAKKVYDELTDEGMKVEIEIYEMKLKL